MDTVVFALLAGAAFGGLNVAIMHGVRRRPDVTAGTLVVMLVSLPVMLAVTLVRDDAGDFGELALWAFLFVGLLVPGAAQLVVGQAFRLAGASRAGLLLGITPLVSAVIAIAVFGEPLRAGLIVGTVLIVAGGVALAWEPDRPKHFAPTGLVLAGAVAVMFGVRDNAVRWLSVDVTGSPQAAATVTFVGAVLIVTIVLITRKSATRRTGRVALAFWPFVPAGIMTALGTILLFEALARGRVTVAAPLIATAGLWTIAFAAVFFGATEKIGLRIVLVAVLIVAGGVLIGLTR